MSQKTITISTLNSHEQRKSNWISVARDLYKLSQMRKELAIQEASLKKELTMLSENKSSKGGGYAFTSIERKGSIKYDEIEELKGVNLEVYRKDSSIMWKLSKV